MNLFFYVYSQIENNQLTQKIYADRDKLRLWMTPQEIYFDYDNHQGHNPDNPPHFKEQLEKQHGLLINVNKLPLKKLPTFIDDQPFTLDNRTENNIITVNKLYHFPFERIETKLFTTVLDAEQYLVAYYLNKTQGKSVNGKIEQSKVNDHQQILDFTYTDQQNNQERVTAERFVINKVKIEDVKSHKDLTFDSLFH